MDPDPISIHPSLTLVVAITTELFSKLDIPVKQATYLCYWDLIEFLKELGAGQSLHSMLTISGTTEFAYYTSCEEYLASICQSEFGHAFVKALEKHILHGKVFCGYVRCIFY